MQSLQILRHPWSANGVTTDSAICSNRSLVLAPPGVQRVYSREQQLDLPRVGYRDLEGRRRHVFELPIPGPDSDGTETLSLQLIGAQSPIHTRIDLAGGWSRESLSQPTGQPQHEPTVGARLQRFLGAHVHLIYAALDEQGNQRGPRTSRGVDLGKVLDLVASAEDDEAQLALIVRIAQSVGSTVADIVENPRRVLRRSRSMERVSAVRQIDAAGIRWLVRQPGRNLLERAGARQQVLAVVREESFDTLENRVIRDLLGRSDKECSAWLDSHRGLETSARSEAVRRYYSCVRRGHRVGPLAALTPVVGAVDPNYALQHDPRYSRVWPWYQQLRRRQEQEDRLWRWGQRTLAEGLQLALAAALDRLERERATTRIPQYTKSLILRSEQEYGRFVDPRSQLGGWIFRRTNDLLGAGILTPDGVQAFEESFETGSRVHELVPDAVVALYDPHRSDGEARLLPIWLRILGEDAATTDPAPEIAQRLSERRGRTTGAFILLDAQGVYGGPGRVSSEFIRVPTSDSVLAHRVEVGIDLPSWIESLVPLLRQTVVGGGG